VVDHGHALGDPHRMVVGQDHDAEPETDALGQLAQRAEDDFGARRHREAGEEVMLDEPDGVESHPIGEHALLEGFFDHRVIVDHRALHLVRQTQSHSTLRVGP
jgi:hypothetical protein